MATPHIKTASHFAKPITLDENVLSKVTKAKYKRDATRLYLRDMLKKKRRLEKEDVVIDSKQLEPIFDALISVHQSSIPEAMNVTQQHKIHTFPRPQVNQLIVLYSRNAAWAKPLKMGEKRTMHEGLNKIMDAYELRIMKSTGWNDQQDALVIRSKEPVNMFALASRISALDGIHLVDLAVPSGDGNDISITKIGKGKWEVNYFIKFGSCIDECSKQHIWTFHVNDKGMVEFISEGGDPLPQWMKKK